MSANDVDYNDNDDDNDDDGDNDGDDGDDDYDNNDTIAMTNDMHANEELCIMSNDSDDDDGKR